MRFAKFAILALALMGALSVRAQGLSEGSKPVSPAKAAVVKELLSLTGSKNLANQIMTQLMSSLRPAFPDVPSEVWDRLSKKLDAEELVDSIVVIYDRHFSIEDLQAVVAFYRTPAGQRLLKELPMVMSEGMAIGQEWGKRKAAELVEELRAEQAAPKKSERP